MTAGVLTLYRTGRTTPTHPCIIGPSGSLDQHCRSSSIRAGSDAIHLRPGSPSRAVVSWANSSGIPIMVLLLEVSRCWLSRRSVQTLEWRRTAVTQSWYRHDVPPGSLSSWLLLACCDKSDGAHPAIHRS